jgi:hypothetical protein
MIFRHLDDEADALVDAEALSVISKLNAKTIKRNLDAVACDLNTRRALYLSAAAERLLALVKPRTRRGNERPGHPRR